MKVVWITPNMLPECWGKVGGEEKSSGGWLGALIPELKKCTNFELHIIIISKQARFKSFQSGNVLYYSIPSNGGVFNHSNKLKYKLRDLVQEINPDIVDFQGLEFSYVKDVKFISGDSIAVATLQGLVSEIHAYYLQGISCKQIIENLTIKDILLFDNLFSRRYKYKQRGVNELAAIKDINFFIGRTDWDRAVISKSKNKFHYFEFGRRVRSEFFKVRWNSKSLDKNTLFVSQAHAPFKGLHILIEAIRIVKKVYPNILVKIAGKDLFNPPNLFGIRILGGYDKLVANMIKKYNLEKNFNFVGYLNQSEMANILSNSSLYVLPSIIENSPNSLLEAQIVGVPVIASFTGGVDSMVSGDMAYFHNPLDHAKLAFNIIHALANKNDTLSKAKNAHEYAVNKQSKLNELDLVEGIYSNVINSNRINLTS